MALRKISVEEFRQVLTLGETIATYPEDKPFSSRLMLGWIGNRPLHVVAASDAVAGEEIVITAYEPDPKEWEPDCRRRTK
ncbi:MAG: DUF4258 domain-containing protein [Planctomycetes bacterium]|nr:DUF4258 domain-containing protein [Planctomycetota bacterium]